MAERAKPKQSRVGTLQQLEHNRENSEIQLPSPKYYDSPELWAEWVNAAQGRAVSAFIEWGSRIEQAHIAYTAQGRSWGRSWGSWTMEHLKISGSYADRLIRVSRNLRSVTPGILPRSFDNLLMLAKVREADERLFDDYVERGLINPDMTRKEVGELYCQARGEEPPAAKPKALKLNQELSRTLERLAQQQGTDPMELLERLLNQASM